MDIAQKNILITGALGGIGSAFVKEFESRGANLILTDLNESKDSKHKFYSADFTNQNQIIDLAENISNDFEKIDILINNAGIGIYKSFEKISPEEWFNSYEVNVSAPFILTKLLLPKLKKAENPTIINIGSICGVNPKECRVAYNSTKFALRGFSLTLSEEYKNSNITVSLLTLGSVMTDFGPTSIEERTKLKAEGKKYLTPDFVAKTLADKIEGGSLEKEICL